jgi:hypothetical protein
MTRFGPRGPMPTDEQLAGAIADALTSDLEPATRTWLLNMAGTWLPNLWASTLEPAVGRVRTTRAKAASRDNKKEGKPATLVELFEEATALARDETLEDAERGRRLVDLLGETDTLRVRLTHQYGPKLAKDIIATRAELGPWSIAAGQGGH